jgi:CBS domain-containing protein
MTTAVITVKPDMTVREAAKVLVDNRISGVPVVDDGGALIGMISEGDLLHRTELDTDKRRRSWWLDMMSASREAAEYVKSHGKTVGDVMTRSVISVDETTSLGEIATLLERNQIKRLPVTRDGKLVGIVSRANLVQALASAPDQPKPVGSPTDRDIRATLMAELAGRKWAFPGRNIMVRDGVVHLWGYQWSDEEVHAMRVAAQGVPGVKGVEDHTAPYPVVPGI